MRRIRSNHSAAPRRRPGLATPAIVATLALILALALIVALGAGTAHAARDRAEDAGGEAVPRLGWLDGEARPVALAWTDSASAAVLGRDACLGRRIRESIGRRRRFLQPNLRGRSPHATLADRAPAP